jgi:hypothetical protein
MLWKMTTRTIMKDIQEERAKQEVQIGSKDPPHSKIQGPFDQNGNV